MWMKCGNIAPSMNICLSYINNGGYFTMRRTASMIKRQNWRTVPLNAAGRCLQARLHINYSSPSDCDGGARHPANSRSLMCFLDNSEGQRSRGISCTALSFSFGLLMGLADKKKKKREKISPDFLTGSDAITSVHLSACDINTLEVLTHRHRGDAAVERKGSTLSDSIIRWESNNSLTITTFLIYLLIIYQPPLNLHSVPSIYVDLGYLLLIISFIYDQGLCTILDSLKLSFICNPVAGFYVCVQYAYTRIYIYIYNVCHQGWKPYIKFSQEQFLRGAQKVILYLC